MTVKARTPGRRRQSGMEAVGDPRQAIIDAAALLFAKQGFAGTSTREIAAAVGLQQPSLFHYFPSKEAILEAIIEALIGPSLAAFERLGRSPGDPAINFYAAVWADARQVARMPDAARALVRIPELRSERFRSLRDGRDRLLLFYAATIVRGQRSGQLIAGNPDAFAHLAVSVVESLSDPTFDVVDCELYADRTADFAVRALLTCPGDLAQIRVAAKTAITADV